MAGFTLANLFSGKQHGFARRDILASEVLDRSTGRFGNFYSNEVAIHKGQHLDIDRPSPADHRIDVEINGRIYGLPADAVTVQR